MVGVLFQHQTSSPAEDYSDSTSQVCASSGCNTLWTQTGSQVCPEVLQRWLLCHWQKDTVLHQKGIKDRGTFVFNSLICPKLLHLYPTKISKNKQQKNHCITADDKTCPADLLLTKNLPYRITGEALQINHFQEIPSPTERCNPTAIRSPKSTGDADDSSLSSNTMRANIRELSAHKSF